MTYTVNLKDTNEAMLLGLVNHDNNPDGIPHQDLWPKVDAIDIDNVVAGSRYIAPTHPWSVTPEGKAVDMVVKKEIPFETNMCRVVIRGDDTSRIYIDEVGYEANRNKEYEAIIEIPVEQGIRTVAIWTVNTELTGGVTFAIYDGDTLRAVSDESWGFVTPIENKIVKERYFKRGWHDITEADIDFIRPPVSIPSGDYDTTGRLTQADVNVEPSLGNHAYKTWPPAAIYPGVPESGELYKRAHPTAKYVHLTDYRTPPAGTEITFVRLVNCPTGKLRLEGSFDDSAKVTVDGVENAHEFNSLLTSVSINVQPGYRKVSFTMVEGPGDSPLHGNWAIYDDSNLVAVSDTTWKACANVDPRRDDKVGELTTIIPTGYMYEVELVSDLGKVDQSTVSSLTNPDGSVVVTHIVPLQDDNWTWTATHINETPPKNTITTIVTKDSMFDVKEVPVTYNRITLDMLFSLTGIEIREINLDVDPDDGSIILNQRVLDDINRRYGVNFDIEDFELTLGVEGYLITASPNAVAFDGATKFIVLRSLTTRIPKTDLVGFTKDNSAVA